MAVSFSFYFTSVKRCLRNMNLCKIHTRFSQFRVASELHSKDILIYRLKQISVFPLTTDLQISYTKSWIRKYNYISTGPFPSLLKRL